MGNGKNPSHQFSRRAFPVPPLCLLGMGGERRLLGSYQIRCPRPSGAEIADRHRAGRDYLDQIRLRSVAGQEGLPTSEAMETTLGTGRAAWLIIQPTRNETMGRERGFRHGGQR